MTKQELIEMTGSEEQAELKKIDSQIETFKKEGIIYEANHSNIVDWGAPERVFGNEPGAYWHATDDQKAEAERLEERCGEAEALLYTRNRTVDLIAAR